MWILQYQMMGKLKLNKIQKVNVMIITAYIIIVTLIVLLK